MKIYRNVVLSRKTLLTHKWRTVLALVGITIGVASVIIMVSIGNGAQREVLDEIEKMGTNLLAVRSARLQKVVGRRRQAVNVTTLKIKDFKAIRDECASVELAAPGHEQGARVKYGNNSTIGTVLGTTPEFSVIRNFTIQSGRYFTEEENRSSKRVAVVGIKVRDQLMDGNDPVGETIRVRNIPFEIIGMFRAKGVSPDGVDQDDKIIIPINTAMRRVFNIDYIRNVFIRVRNRDTMERAEAEVRELLRERHGLNRKNKPDDFRIMNQLTAIKAETETTESFTLLIAGTAGISLFVGGIGILGVMLLAVREREGEIGLRLAVGARTKDIMAQFLSEALILGSLGSGAGVALGVGGAAALGWLTQWRTFIDPGTIFVAIVFSLLIGPLFGLYPARKASQLDPIESLRPK